MSKKTQQPSKIITDTLSHIPEPNKDRVKKVFESYDANFPLVLKVQTVLLRVIEKDINLLPQILGRLEKHYTLHTAHHHPYVRETREVTVTFFSSLYEELGCTEGTKINT